jgi:hypothetical protein
LTVLLLVGLKLDRRNGTTRIWCENGEEITKQNYYSRLIQSNETKFWVTQGDEAYRCMYSLFHFFIMFFLFVVLILTLKIQHLHHFFVSLNHSEAVNGVFYYLLTDEQIYKLNDLKRSLMHLEKNYNSKYGPYPIIIFHSLHPYLTFRLQETFLLSKKTKMTRRKR